MSELILRAVAVLRLRLETGFSAAGARVLLTFFETPLVEAAFFTARFGAAFFTARFGAAFFFSAVLAAAFFFAADRGAFFALFLAAFALRLAGPLFPAVFVDAFFLPGALTGAAFEALRFLPAGFLPAGFLLAGFVLPEDAFFLEARTAGAFLLLLGPELLDLAAFFLARFDIQVPL